LLTARMRSFCASGVGLVRATADIKYHSEW
jgi:hypothetical protein